jgi:NAD(P)-dependent dehydrogenase (short-subunit alcohol dehydrogenase family)
MNLTRTMALDHADEGIRINGVCPGYMRTAMTTGFSENPAVEAELKECIPQRRGCNPIEVAKTVLFLASDDASYMNGHGMYLLQKESNHVDKSSSFGCRWRLDSRQRWSEFSQTLCSQGKSQA